MDSCQDSPSIMGQETQVRSLFVLAIKATVYFHGQDWEILNNFRRKFSLGLGLGLGSGFGLDFGFAKISILKFNITLYAFIGSFSQCLTLTKDR